LRDEIKFRSAGPLCDLRVIAEGRLRPAATAHHRRPRHGRGSRSCVASGGGGRRCGRLGGDSGDRASGLDGPATPREIPRPTDPTANRSAWP